MVGLNFEWLNLKLATRIKLFYRHIIIATLVCISCYFLLKYETLRKFHELGRSDYNWESREAKINNTNIYRSLDSFLNGNYIVFNVLPRHEVDAMFYSNQNVYRLFPDEDVLKNLKAAGYKIAAFTDHDDQLLPDYIKNDPDVVIIDMVLMK